MSTTGTRVVAILPLPGTTITATKLASTTGAAVIDGTTISLRQSGLTLTNGNVVQLGFAGIYDSTATGLFETLTGTQTPSGGRPIYPTPISVKTTVPTVAPTETSSTLPVLTTSPASSTSATSSSSTTSTSSIGVASGVGVSRCVAVVGLVFALLAGFRA